MLMNDAEDRIGLQPRFAEPLQDRLFRTRVRTEELAAPLSPEDQVVQAMDDASPTKWHRAHTTWFFEIFLLEPHLPSYRRFDDRFHYCFNSYYVQAGARHPRPLRGMLTRPSCDEVAAYRRHVDAGLAALFEHFDDGLPEEIKGLIELGINHEQQHQELILTDILSLFSANPLRPPYSEKYFADRHLYSSDEPSWVAQDAGIRQVGHCGDAFHFDNEGPAHAVLLQPFRLCDRLVTNGDWLEFIKDGGYATPTLWLSDGWHAVCTHGWEAPGYWERADGEWQQMTLAGLSSVEVQAAVSNVSYYEAEAFARWAGKRLPTECEWEVAVNANPSAFKQLYSDVWQWTTSAYAAYPGYRPAKGAVGEYNGKFMCSQYVLRGASHATAPGHSRTTYRNFFYPDARWQFTGVRLAEDAV